LGGAHTRTGRYAWAGHSRGFRKGRMPNRSQEVDRFMERLDHPLKEGVERLRAAILDSNDQITEHIKWNAPSFRYAGEDRMTFKLFPVERVLLVFHRGAKVKGDDAGDFVFDDDSGLLRWVANDRAVVALRNVEDVEAKQPALVDVVNRWVVT
jgi:hypothetical protein